MVRTSNSNGQSLVEVVVSMGIISMILVGLVSAITYSLANTQFARNKALATKYSQEAIEWYRSERDTLGWAAFKSYAPTATCTIKNNYCLNTFGWSPGTCIGVIIDDYYIFKRNSYLQTESPDRIKVSVTTQWTQGRRTPTVVLSTYLTNYRGSSSVPPINCDFPASPGPTPVPSPQQLPDLVVSSITFDSGYMTVIANNVGQAPISQPFDLSANYTLSTGGSAGSGQRQVNPSQYGPYYLVFIPANPCIVIGQADSSNEIGESNEGNNSQTKNFTCLFPSPSPTPTPVPSPLECSIGTTCYQSLCQSVCNGIGKPYGCCKDECTCVCSNTPPAYSCVN